MLRLHNILRRLWLNLSWLEFGNIFMILRDEIHNAILIEISKFMPVIFVLIYVVLYSSFSTQMTVCASTAFLTVKTRLYQQWNDRWLLHNGMHSVASRNVTIYRCFLFSPIPHSIHYTHTHARFRHTHSCLDSSSVSNSFSERNNLVINYLPSFLKNYNHFLLLDKFYVHFEYLFCWY